MSNVLMGNSLWQLVMQSDHVSKFVLIILLALSIACWTVFLYKIVLLRIKKNHMKKALAAIKSTNTIDEMLMVATQLANTVPGYFLSKNLNYLKSLLETQKEIGKTEISERDWELLQANMFQTIDGMIHADESYIALLSTSAAVAPLLGLFGTVWGLVHSFIRISEKQMADITTVAPGIAEALVTTLAGLIVAIPALVMYNYLLVQIRYLEQQYATFADKIGLIVQRLLMRASHGTIYAQKQADGFGIDRHSSNAAH